jgi:hypothetical protein
MKTMRREFLFLLVLTAACEAGTIPLIPDAEPDTNWAPLLQGTTQRGPVQGHLIVFAYDNQDPLPGMQVILQFADGQRVDALTNDSGRADFYEPDLYGPMDLHFLHDDYHRRSWIGVDAGIVTVRMSRVSVPSGSSATRLPPSSNQDVTVRGMNDLPASDGERVRFAFVTNDFLNSVSVAHSVFEAVPGPELSLNIEYYPGYRLDLIAVGGLTTRSGAGQWTIPWEDITRIGVGNDPDPEEAQIIELTHALDQDFEFEFLESPQLITDDLMDDWDAFVHIAEPNFARILIPAIHGTGVTRVAKVPQLNGSFSGSNYVPVLWGTAADGAFSPQLIASGPKKRAVGRLVLPRSHALLQGSTLELSLPPRPVELSQIWLWAERRWLIHIFEQREQVVLPQDPGTPSFAPMVVDYGIDRLDVGDFTGDSVIQVQCSADTRIR